MKCLCALFVIPLLGAVRYGSRGNHVGISSAGQLGDDDAKEVNLTDREAPRVSMKEVPDESRGPRVSRTSMAELQHGNDKSNGQTATQKSKLKEEENGEDPPKSRVSAVGLILAALSAVFNGTFPITSKLQKEESNPIIFNTMLCMGVLVSSLLVIPFFPLVTPPGGGFPLGWSWPGALAGGLLVLATLCTFIAIPLAGLATGSAIWSCSAMVVAFLWGAVGPKGIAQRASSLALSICALLILLTGVLILNLRAVLANKLFASQCPSVVESQLATSFAQSEEANVDGQSESALPASAGSGGKAAVGVAFAITVGLFGGSILVPAHYVSPALKGLPLLPSFGCGAAAVGTLVGLCYWTCYRGMSLSLRSGGALAHELRSEVVVSGMAAGVLWNLGNIAQVLAMDYYHMPYGVSYPVFNCGLLVAGIWGIYFFKEVKDGKQILIFWMGACVLMVGVVILGLYGPGTYVGQDM